MHLICGILHLDGGSADDARLRAMIAQLDVPRLKPAVRLWREGAIALSVLDFTAPGKSTSALPEQGASIIAADVRFDDPAMIQKIEGATAPPPEDALLLQFLKTHGPISLDRILGDFAFACWDRNSQRLTCGRDTFGIRPFSYVYQPGGFSLSPRCRRLCMAAASSRRGSMKTS
jgi:asparagine synthase (glutamine-hydrolysing)